MNSFLDYDAVCYFAEKIRKNTKSWALLDQDKNWMFALIEFGDDGVLEAEKFIKKENYQFLISSRMVKRRIELVITAIAPNANIMKTDQFLFDLENIRCSLKISEKIAIYSEKSEGEKTVEILLQEQQLNEQQLSLRHFFKFCGKITNLERFQLCDTALELADIDSILPMSKCQQKIDEQLSQRLNYYALMVSLNPDVRVEIEKINCSTVKLFSAVFAAYKRDEKKTVEIIRMNLNENEMIRNLIEIEKDVQQKGISKSTERNFLLLNQEHEP